MALITNHYAGHELALGHTYQEQIGTNAQLAADVFVRVIRWTDEIASSPERYHSVFIRKVEWANFERVSHQQKGGDQVRFAITTAAIATINSAELSTPKRPRTRPPFRYAAAGFHSGP
jgi:hypothetical protein